AGLLLLVLAAAALVVLARWPRERSAAGTGAVEQTASPLPRAPAEMAAVATISREPEETRDVVAHERGASRVDRPDAAAAPADPGVLGCVVYGRVTTADGAAEQTARLWVAVTDFAGERRQVAVTPEGDYSLDGLAPGEWELDVTGDG